MVVRYRWAGTGDAEVLGAMNAELIRDEGHRNPMDRSSLVERMVGFLNSGYRALIASDEKSIFGYLLARDDGDHLYLRQLYVSPESRRHGIGRSLVEALADTWGKGRRMRIEVLSGNAIAIAFWRDIGFGDYAITLEREPGNSRE